MLHLHVCLVSIAMYEVCVWMAGGLGALTYILRCIMWQLWFTKSQSR
jgi:hypothetical protein